MSREVLMKRLIMARLNCRESHPEKDRCPTCNILLDAATELSESEGSDALLFMYVLGAACLFIGAVFGAMLA